jgi:Protein of unknown function (DUF2849)
VKILTGNDLPSGDVVWWDGKDWSRSIGDAVDVADGGEAILKVEEAARRVNASYEVEADSGGVPLHIKDRVRAAGPTVRHDLAINPAIQIVKA